MKLYLQILIIGILLFSSNCQTCTVGGGSGAANGFYNAPAGAASRTCVSSASGGSDTCQSTFSDQANQAARTPPQADCDFCAASGEYLDRIATVTGVICSATTCAAGYTDMTNGGAASTALTRNCDTCLSSSHTLNGGQCYANCAANTYLTKNDGTCGTSCEAGYTDSSSGGAASATLGANCLYCLRGLQKKDNGVCECQTPNLYLTSPSSGACDAACESGFTDQANGANPSTSSGGICIYCLSGNSLNRNKCYKSCSTGEYFTQHDGTCGTSCASGYTDKADGTAASTSLGADCQYCLTDYTENTNNGQCEKSSSQILKASFFILLLIALIF